MGLFGFGKKKSPSDIALVIDAGSAAVSAAYARIAPYAPPEFIYVAELPVARREGEEHSLPGLERALHELMGRVLTEGAPALLRETGAAVVHHAFAAFGAPWTETRPLIVRFEERRPFAFTRSILAKGREEAVPEGRRAAEDEILTVLLNGYETRHPYGRQATNAEATLLASTVDESAAGVVDRALGRVFAGQSARTRAFLPATATAIARLYPHQKEHVIVAVHGDATEIARVARGRLAASVAVPHGTHEAAAAGGFSDARVGRETAALARRAWQDAVRAGIEGVAGEGAPDTFFLLAPRAARRYFKDALAESAPRATVVALSPAHLATTVWNRAAEEPDAGLILLTLHAAHAAGEPGDTSVAGGN
jgi:hypothetical protein